MKDIVNDTNVIKKKNDTRDDSARTYLASIIARSQLTVIVVI